MSVSITTINKAKKRVITNGLLYNYYTINAGSILPSGWRMPTKTECENLLGYTELLFSPLKDTDPTNWVSGGGTNTTGFTSVGAGARLLYNSIYVFSDYKLFNYIWTSTGLSNKSILGISSVDNFSSFGGFFTWSNKAGASIRLVRTSSEGWVDGETVIDYDGNVYNTVNINGTIWIVQNIATTHFMDGTLIPEITDATQWLNSTSPGLCAYNNDWSYVYK